VRSQYCHNFWWLKRESCYKTPMAKVRDPSSLRKLTNEQELVEVETATIGAVSSTLKTHSPASEKERLVDDNGEVRRS